MPTPVLFQDQQVDVRLIGGSNGDVESTRWFASRVLAAPTTEGALTIAWPMDPNRFLPVLLPVVPNDTLALAARGDDGQLFAADARVEQTDSDAPRLVVRVCSPWRPLDRRAEARRSANIRAQRAAGSAPRPRRWMPTLAGALCAGLIVLGGAHQIADTSTGAEQPTALAALSVRPVAATRTTSDPAARATRSTAPRSSSGQTWSAYGYAIQAPTTLWPTLDLIREKGGYDWVLDSLDASQTQVRFGNLAPRTMGIYNAQQNLIVIADPLRTASVEVVAATLVHESTHLSDAQHGRWENSTAACLKFEQRAFANEAAFWHAVYGPEGKRVPADDWESSLNNLLIAGAVSDNLLGAYADECGSLGTHGG